MPKDLSDMKICFLGLTMLECVFNNLLSMVAFSDISWCHLISSKLKYITFKKPRISLDQDFLRWLCPLF